jgi:catechol 2,3-dioxygenase-like lactoylglutathione lyase family enzyme
MAVMIEHVNVTASDGAATSQMLCDVFGWRVRWEGPAKLGGYTWHVGEDNSYVAIWQAPEGHELSGRRVPLGRLNHVGVVVNDLDAIERRVLEASLRPFSHGDYEPGRRFYFLDRDGVEYEVVSYR